MCLLSVERAVTGIGRLGDVLKEMREILKRPRPISGALAFDRTGPTYIPRRIEKHTEVHVCARCFMQGVKPLDDDEFRRADLALTDARMRFETPLRNLCGPPTTEFAEVARESLEIRGLWNITQMLRRAVVVRKIVIGRNHNHPTARLHLLGKQSRERRFSGCNGTRDTHHDSATKRLAMRFRFDRDHPNGVIEEKEFRLRERHIAEDTRTALLLPYLAAMENL